MVGSKIVHWLATSAVITTPFFAMEDAHAAKCVASGTAECYFEESIEVYSENFGRDVANVLKDLDVKGYAFSVVDRGGREILSVSDGYRDTNAGVFSRYTPSQIGSISKLLTRMVVLRSLEIHEKAPAYRTRGCRVSGASRVFDLLPSVFGRVTHPDYRSVTINDMLAHDAGLSWCSAWDRYDTFPNDRRWDYLKMLETGNGPRLRTQCRIDGGVVTADCTGKRDCYSNNSYVFATMLIPLIKGSCSGKKAEVEQEILRRCPRGALGASREKDDCMIHAAFDILGEEANDIVTDMVWAPIHANWYSFCDPTTNMWTNPSGWFDHKYDAKTETQYLAPGENRPDVRGCGVGAWYTTAFYLARALSRNWYGNFLLDSSSLVGFPGEHNGSRPKYQSHSFKLGVGLTAVVLVNSPKLDFHGFEEAIRREYNDNIRTPMSSDPRSTPFWDETWGTTWKCRFRGSSETSFELRFSQWDRPHAVFPNDWNGFGTEETWFVNRAEGSSISGKYRYHGLGTTLYGSNSFPGSFTASLSGSVSAGTGRLQVHRKDDRSGWQGWYTCTP